MRGATIPTHVQVSGVQLAGLTNEANVIGDPLSSSAAPWDLAAANYALPSRIQLQFFPQPSTHELTLSITYPRPPSTAFHPNLTLVFGVSCSSRKYEAVVTTLQSFHPGGTTPTG